MVMLNTNKIQEIGDMISEQMRTLNLNDSSFIINVDADSFKKIDEDLFYRINGTDKEFIPSEKEILISFPNVKLIINEKGE
jgi:DNA-binding helix-hairpin-helix protein with protein kinase domain